MKKYISLLLIFLNLWLDTAIAVDKINEDGYNKASVEPYSINIRVLPSFNSKVIKTLKKDSVIKYNWRLKDWFIKIRYTGKDWKEYYGYTLWKLLRPLETNETKPILNPTRKDWKLESKILNSTDFRNSNYPHFLSVLSYKNLQKTPTRNLEQVNSSYIRLSRYYDVLIKLYRQDKEKAKDKDIRANDDFIAEASTIFYSLHNYLLYLNNTDRDANIAWNWSYEGMIKSPKTCVIWYTNMSLGWLNAIAWMMPIELDKNLYKDSNWLFFALTDNQILNSKEVEKCKSEINIIFKDKDFIQRTLLKNIK